jgi:polar amino acid transport system substrate-binding protein
MHLSLRAAFLIAAAAAAGPAAADGVLDRLKQSGEIRIGVRSDAPPLSYTGKDGKPAGYSILVCDAVAAELGKAVGHDPLTVTPVVVGTDDRFAALKSGKVDMLCGADTITLSRREEIDFSIPIFVDGAAVLLRRDSATNLDALAGKKIGVRAGTTTEEAVRGTLAAKKMQADVVTFESHPDGLKALEDHEIDAYFGDQSILFQLYFQSAKKADLVVSDNTLTIETQGLGLPRGDEDFRLAVDGAISELYRAGQMQAFFTQAFPGASPGLALKAMFLIAPQLP